MRFIRLQNRALIFFSLFSFGCNSFLEVFETDPKWKLEVKEISKDYSSGEIIAFNEIIGPDKKKEIILKDSKLNCFVERNFILNDRDLVCDNISFHVYCSTNKTLEVKIPAGRRKIYSIKLSCLSYWR